MPEAADVLGAWFVQLDVTGDVNLSSVVGSASRELLSRVYIPVAILPLGVRANEAHHAVSSGDIPC